MSLPRTYSLELHFEKDHFWAAVKELPGCFATGRDMDELAEALTEAINMYLGTEEVRSVKIDVTQETPPVPARLELLPC